MRLYNPEPRPATPLEPLPSDVPEPQPWTPEPEPYYPSEPLPTDVPEPMPSDVPEPPPVDPGFKLSILERS